MILIYYRVQTDYITFYRAIKRSSRASEFYVRCQ